MVATKNIHHFAICVFQSDIVIAWYKKTFGFNVEKQFEVGEAAKIKITHLTNSAGIRLELVELPPSAQEKTPPRSVNAPGLSHVALAVENILEAVSTLKEMNVSIVQDIKEIADFKVKTAWIRDGEGNAVELVESYA